MGRLTTGGALQLLGKTPDQGMAQLLAKCLLKAPSLYEWIQIMPDSFIDAAARQEWIKQQEFAEVNK